MPALPLAQQDTDNQDPIPAAVREAVAQPQAPQQAVPAQAAPAAQPGDRVPGTMTQTYPQQGQAVPTQTAQTQPQQQPQDQPQGQPQGGQQVAQSEPPPRAPRPFIDPRPYASLAEHAPQYRQLIDQVSEQTGVSPQRLALTWAQEGGFRTQVPDGKAGEKGPLQIMPSTAAQFDPKGQLNLNDLRDNLTAAGRYINSLDSKFGQDTPSSVGAYQGGEGSVRDILAHPDRAMQDHPNTMSRIANSFPGQQVTPGSFTAEQKMDPHELIKVASQQGPDGFLRYVAQTSQQAGTTMTDGMRAAEATLVGFMASRGDVAGMQHARDFVLQLSHAGVNQNLMAAHQALGAGDAAGAAQYLAKSHAFFPDSTMGSFGVDDKGQVWGQRLDEHSGKPMGPTFKVDQQGIQQMLNQTTDPNKFLQMAQEEQKNAASIRHSDAMGDYYGKLLDSRQQIATGHDDARRDAAQTSADARVEAANVRAAARQGQGPAAALSKQADKEAASNFSDLTMPDVPEAQRGVMAETFHDIRMGGVTEPQAMAVTKGIHSGALQLVRGANGDYGVMDPKDKSGKPIAVLSQSVGDRLAGAKVINPQQQASTPVGSGAASPVARATGVSSNLSGTVQQQQSSAIPVS